MIENDPNNFCTTIKTYEHTVRRNSLEVVGMVHVAQPSYYNNIQSHLNGRAADGWDVHYELVQAPDDEDLKGIEPKDVAKLVLLAIGPGSALSMFDGLGLVKQTDVMDYRKDWHNHDVSALELVRGLGWRQSFAGLFSAGFSAALRMLPPEERAEEIAETMENLESRFRGGERSSSLINKVLKFAGADTDEVFLNTRNEVALTAVKSRLAASPMTDIVMAWGEAHLQGLGDGAEELGFRQVDQKHVLAIDYPTMIEFARRQSA